MFVIANHVHLKKPLAFLYKLYLITKSLPVDAFLQTHGIEEFFMKSIMKI